MAQLTSFSTKLVLLGEAAVGKSSLAVRFCRCVAATAATVAARRAHRLAPPPPPARTTAARARALTLTRARHLCRAVLRVCATSPLAPRPPSLRPRCDATLVCSGEFFEYQEPTIGGEHA